MNDRMIRRGEVLFHADLEPLLQPHGSVQPHPENYNEGDVDEIMASIHHNGMYRPIYVQKSTGYIIAGNHTWEAVGRLHSDVCPMVLLDVDDAAARKIMVADNRLASLAMPNYPALVALLDQIEEHSTLEGTGYRPNDVEVLKHLAEIPLEFDEFAQWPTFSVQVHPRLLKAFRRITREADNDRDRFEVLLRLAGWDGA